MTPQQLRAARAGLGWTQDRLASEAGINRNSVNYWERGAARRNRADRPQKALPLIEAAFARHGVTFPGNAVSFSGNANT